MERARCSACDRFDGKTFYFERLLSIGNELAQEPNQNSTFQNTAIQNFNTVGFELFPDDDDDQAEVEDDDEGERRKMTTRGGKRWRLMDRNSNSNRNTNTNSNRNTSTSRNTHRNMNMKRDRNQKLDVKWRRGKIDEDLNQRTKTKVSGYHQGRDSDLER